MRSGVRVPETVHVHPFDYTISTDRTELLEADLACETDLLGHCEPKQLRILLDVGAAPDVVAETLVHELLHGVLSVTGLDQELDDAGEGLVTRLAPPLLALIRDNPELLAYLTA